MLFWEKLLSFILLIYWHIKKQGLCIPFIYGWTVLHSWQMKPDAFTQLKRKEWTVLHN